jgi:hypothetical protein
MLAETLDHLLFLLAKDENMIHKQRYRLEPNLHLPPSIEVFQIHLPATGVFHEE